MKLHTCQLSWFSRESQSFSSILPASQLEHQISRELFTMAFLKLFFIYFIILDISNRKIKQGDLLLLFELSSIGKHKQSNQIDVYLTSLLIGQKPTNQIAQYLNGKLAWFLHVVYRDFTGRDFGSLQKEFLGTFPLGFEGVERLDLQKERNFKESFFHFQLLCHLSHVQKNSLFPYIWWCFAKKKLKNLRKENITRTIKWKALFWSCC